MAAIDRERVRALYRQACHGAGAEPRWAARDELDRIAQERGRTAAAVLNEQGLDLSAYFHSKPISR